MGEKMELVCPAGNLQSLKMAVDSGADAVYVGLSNNTNARYFAGLNFDEHTLADGVRYAHERGRRVFMAINTYPQQSRWPLWMQAIDTAAGLQMDAVILADIGLLDYAARQHPDLPRHLSVQGSATHLESLNFYHQHFGIRRAVLPRVLSLRQVERLTAKSPVEIETFGFGSLCIMAEGRCYLSSYITGDSPNNCGACSPAHAVRWQETPRGLESRLNNVLIDRYRPDENAAYPTLCKGRFEVDGNIFHALEEPTSLNALDLLPQLAKAGVKAIKIEGRQRSPAYVAKVTRVWRAAIDRWQRQGDAFVAEPSWHAALASVSEGSQTTLGALHRSWQ